VRPEEAALDIHSLLGDNRDDEIFDSKHVVPPSNQGNRLLLTILQRHWRRNNYLRDWISMHAGALSI